MARTLKIFICCLPILLGNTGLNGQELYSVSTLPFNLRDYDEFAATPYNGGLVFCSNRPQNVFIIRMNSDGQPLLDLYFARKKDNQKWSSPELLPKEINSRFYEGPSTFSKDGRTIFFTKGDAETEGIYTSTFNGSSWGPVEPFPFNDPASMTAQPCLSSDGKLLFFSSTRRGGTGGFDLYVCTLNRSNQWSRPKNLGPEINTADDEKYPFFHANGKLYFSSNRKNGWGGYDIYYTMEKDGKWIKPVLLPQQINSKFNEIGFTTDSIDRHGFFSSDRNNRDNLFDIFGYMLNFPLVDFKSCEAQKKNKYLYEFFEENALDTDTTTFLYEWDFGDGTKIRGRDLKVEHAFKQPGDYLVQLNVIDTITGQIMLQQAANITPVRDIEQPYIQCPDTFQVNKEVSLDASKSYLPNKTITNYYWDFGDGQISVGKEIKHTFLEPGIYKITLCIAYIDRNKPAFDSRYKQIVITP